MEHLRDPSKTKFIRLSLLKTAVYLLAVIAIIIAGKHFFKDEMEMLMAVARHNLPAFYAIFFLLEILPGQLPPEIFFILYSKETTSFPAFMRAVFLLACLSYIAINLSYYIGKILPRLKPGNWFEKNSKMVAQYWQRDHRFRDVHSPAFCLHQHGCRVFEFSVMEVQAADARTLHSFFSLRTYRLFYYVSENVIRCVKSPC